METEDELREQLDKVNGLLATSDASRNPYHWLLKLTQEKIVYNLRRHHKRKRVIKVNATS